MVANLQLFRRRTNYEIYDIILYIIEYEYYSSISIIP